MPPTIKVIELSENLWIDIDIHKEKYFEFSVYEIYQVAEKYWGVVGRTDSRTVFSLGFRIPFAKEKD